MTRALAHIALALALGLSACVVKSKPSAVQCFKDKDCDPGEVCGDDHICYGNPPNLPLAVELDPPADRADLPPADIASFPTSWPNGYFDLAWPSDQAPVTISGRVVLASDPSVSVAARLQFRRASRIPGGPAYVVNAQSTPGVTDGPSFQAVMLPNAVGETYEVVILPDDTGQSPTPAQLAPPYRQRGFSFTVSTGSIVFPLGGQNPQGAEKRVHGRVLDATGKGVEGLAVRALGKFGPLDASEIASNEAATAKDGRFTLLLPVAWLDDFDIAMTPSGPALPEVHLTGVHVDDPVDTQPVDLALPDLMLPSYPAPVAFDLPVFGTAPEGGTEFAIGATVTLSTVLVDQGNVRIVYRATAQIDSEGTASLMLVPGTLGQNRQYTLDVVPLPESDLSQVWGTTIEVGPSAGVLSGGPPLPLRALLTGQILDHLGVPAEGVKVRLSPSIKFIHDLAGTTVNLTDARWPETTTAADGRFSLWVDQSILGHVAAYSLQLEPPADSLLPYWSLEDIGVLTAASGSLDLGELTLPDAAYGRATVKDAGGMPVPGARVSVYEIADNTVCQMFANDPTCVAPAPLRAFGTAGDDGMLRIVLPRPAP